MTTIFKRLTFCVPASESLYATPKGAMTIERYETLLANEKAFAVQKKLQSQNNSLKHSYGKTNFDNFRLSEVLSIRNDKCIDFYGCSSF
jgi:hypothetical protein